MNDPVFVNVKPEVKPRNGVSRFEMTGLAAILILTGLVYGQALGFHFVNFDDNAHVFENPHVRSGINLNNFYWAFGIHGPSQWHPLAWISHQADSQLFGARVQGRDAGGHHGVNVLLHLCNVVMVYATFRSLSGRAEPAICSAAIFAIHPLNVESVAWVSERRNVLCVLFSLGTILAYKRYIRRERWQDYLIVMVMLTLALMAKPLAVTLPCVLWLLDYWPLKRTGERLDPADHSIFLRTWHRGLPLIDKLPLLALSAISSVLTIKCQQAAGVVSSFNDISLPIRLINSLAAYGAYLQAMIWPVNLCNFYPHPALRGLDPWKTLMIPAIAGAVILVILTLVAFASRRRYPGLIIGWLWFLGTLVPMIGLFQVGSQQRADRYMYFPMLGLLLAVTAHFPWDRFRTSISRRQLLGFWVLVVLLLAQRTWDQTSTWHDSLTLFEHALTVNSRNSWAHLNAGSARQDRGEWDLAAKHYLAALEIDPRYSLAHYNLGVLLYDSGNVQGAAQRFMEAVRLDPRNAKAWVRLGAIHGNHGRVDLAEQYFKIACEADPECVDAWFNLGIILEQQDRQQAREAYLTALGIDPQFRPARDHLAQMGSDNKN